jgi:translation initiation factor IF-2
LPQRIYALAKELKLDNTDLMEICVKAGVTGKGSALASLTDEEVAKVRSFLAAPKGGAAPPAEAPSKSAPVPPLAPPPQRPAAPTTMRREDYVAPAGAPTKPPVTFPKLDSRPPSEPKKKPPGGEDRKPPIRISPALKLAPMPPSQQPPATRTPDEPAPQKPDIRLPVDAIRASKSGGATPLSEHMRKHEQRRKSETTKDGPPAGPLPPGGKRSMPGDPLTPPGRDRSSRRSAGAGTGAPLGPGKGTPGKEGEGGDTLGGREQRQLKRKRTTTGRRSDDDDGPSTRSRLTRNRRAGVSTAAPRKTSVVIDLPCTVRSFSEGIGVPARQVLAKLLGLGTMANINAELSAETAELLAVELGIDVQFKQPQSLEDQLLTNIEQEADPPESLVPRAPVVTFLGHVDHGKTSLLDRIIGINVVSGESGGITQHIRAYRIEKDGRPIAFVDTPGHEAFTEMRARGANVTDIAVLVVAADDGVMPQTEEAISHARAAGVPIVVALNKMDLPGVNLDRILQQLATSGLLATEWGGDTEVVKCSALKGDGVDELLDTLLTIAELHDFRANPARQAYGTCLESELHEGRGVVAKLLIQNGTLKVGDVVVCGSAYGRVKAMYDTLQPRTTHNEAGPSVPVNVTGLNEAPQAGQHFYVLSDIAQAREIAEQRESTQRRVALSGGPSHVTLENLFERLGSADQVQLLNLILRADTRGSIEAIQKELSKLDHPEVQIKILQATVGGITEADVHLADASDGIIIGFNVVPDEGARSLADQRGVQVRRYDIIYQVTADVKAALEGLLKPEQRSVDLGRALVLRTFSISRIGTIAGCRVLSGNIERSGRIRVIRDNRVVGDYALDTLRREKDDAREVREGLECGIKLAGFNDVKEGDVLECYRYEQVARTISTG